MHLFAAGAVMFSSFASSVDSELAPLELATGALLKLSRGYGDVVPHDTDLTWREPDFLQTYHHLWSILEENGEQSENPVRGSDPLRLYKL